MRRLSLVIQGTIEVYGDSGELVSRSPISQAPMEIVGMAPVPIEEALRALSSQCVELLKREPAAEVPDGG